MNLKIQYKTISYNLYLNFLYFIQKFCNLYNLKFKKFTIKSQSSRFSLLKSPHIHKVSWRAYKLLNYRSMFIIKNLNINIFKNLKLLCKLINKNSLIKFISYN